MLIRKHYVAIGIEISAISQFQRPQAMQLRKAERQDSAAGEMGNLCQAVPFARSFATHCSSKPLTRRNRF